MIYTLTINPALDCAMFADSLALGQVNRCNRQDFRAGGKGLNVSRALSDLSVENTAVFVAGNRFAGAELTRLIGESGIKTAVIREESCDTRINVKVISRAENSGTQTTEINGRFAVGNETLAAVRETLRSRLKCGDMLVIAGSLPENAPANFYADLSREFTAAGVAVIVDTSGEPLRLVAERGSPLLIAPNAHELWELTGKTPGNFRRNSPQRLSAPEEGFRRLPPETLEQAAEIAGGLPCDCLVTMGELGAVMCSGGSKYVCAVENPCKSAYTVGAGDNFLAGFIAEYIGSHDYEKALAAGVSVAGRYVERGINPAE